MSDNSDSEYESDDDEDYVPGKEFSFSLSIRQIDMCVQYILLILTISISYLVFKAQHISMSESKML